MAETFFSECTPAPEPTSWQVQCPSCGDQIECDMDEDADGNFSKSDRDGDPVANCDCGCFFIPSRVTVRAAA